MADIVDITLEEIRARLREAAPALQARGVPRLALFGSWVRGNARPDSDLDILIDTTARGESPPFDFFEVLHLIENTTGLRAQISMRSLLKPRIAERIADDLIQVF